MVADVKVFLKSDDTKLCIEEAKYIAYVESVLIAYNLDPTESQFMVFNIQQDPSKYS
ncbi:TPA: hypothetical protein RSW61_004631 [Vibrio harveyi]|nr:hypothetical protein [Vibrio harveyi]